MNTPPREILTIDTCIFINYNMNTDRMLELLQPLIEQECKFILSEITVKELNKHYELPYVAMSKSIKCIQSNLPLFSDNQDIMNKFTDFTESLLKEKVSNNPLDKFIKTTKTEIIPYENVTLRSIMESYFGTDLPFHSKKKAEFPDAVAIYSLDQWLTDFNAQINPPQSDTIHQSNPTVPNPIVKINAISSDSDWNLFSEKFPNRWMCYKSIEMAVKQMTQMRHK